MLLIARSKLQWVDKNDPSVLLDFPNGQPAKMLPTGETYYLEKLNETTNSINTTYTISNKVAHQASIHKYQIHATIFMFDAELEGAVVDAPIFTPMTHMEGDSLVMKQAERQRNLSKGSAYYLVNIINAQRQLERDLGSGKLTRNDHTLIATQRAVIVAALRAAGYAEYVENYEIQMLTEMLTETRLDWDHSLVAVNIISITVITWLWLVTRVAGFWQRLISHIS